MLKHKVNYICCFLAGSVLSWPASAMEIEELKDSELTAEEKMWLEDDSFFETLSVNQGSLKWVAPKLTENSYELHSHIYLTGDILKTRQVHFEQCHLNLDEIRAIDIVYNIDTTTGLKVLSSKGVGRYKVKKAKIELFDVKDGAQICISGRNRTLNYNRESRLWEIHRGPFMRKFLDGYYPMHLQETVSWKGSPLKWYGINYEHNPVASKSAGYQPAKRFSKDNTSVIIDYWFEGRLKPTYQFSER